MKEKQGKLLNSR